MASLAIGAIGGSGGGIERGPADGGAGTDGGGADAYEARGPIETGGMEALGPTGGGGMLGAETRGAMGAGGAEDAGPLRGTFGAIGALGAIGAFAECGRNIEDATRTAGSAASALPDGVFADRCPVSFAIRKF
jgi:hypothetical protein